MKLPGVIHIFWKTWLRITQSFSLVWMLKEVKFQFLTDSDTYTQSNVGYTNKKMTSRHKQDQWSSNPTQVGQKAGIPLFLSHWHFPQKNSYFSRIFLPFCYLINICSAQCVYTQSHAYIVKISTTYYKASTTIFRLFWDAESWNFSNIKTFDAFMTLLLLPV